MDGKFVINHARLTLLIGRVEPFNLKTLIALLRHVLRQKEGSKEESKKDVWEVKQIMTF